MISAPNSKPKETETRASRTMVVLARLNASLFVLTSIFTFYSPLATISDRIILADIFAVLAVLFFLLSRKTVLVPLSVLGFVIYTIALGIGLVFSLDPFLSFLEVIAHVFGVLVVLVLVNLFHSDRGIQLLIHLLSIAILVASLLGLVNLLGGSLSDLLPGSYGSATFANTGQAGSYFLTALAVLIPYLLSNPKSPSWITKMAVLLGTAFLILTMKRAAIIGFAVAVCASLPMILVMKRGPTSLWRGLQLTTFIAILASVVLVTVSTNPALRAWIEQKTQSATTALDEDSFLMRNWGNSLDAFSEMPVTGTGIGAFAEYRGSHEVHSTPLKLLGETGVIGTFGYAIFLYTILTMFPKLWRLRPYSSYQQFLLLLIPFFLGNAVSWIYTYHARKREFWIYLAIVTILHLLSAREQNRSKTAQHN